MNIDVGARPGNSPQLGKLGYPIFFGPTRCDQIPDVARRIIVGVEAVGTIVEEQKAAVDLKPANRRRLPYVAVHLVGGWKGGAQSGI
jgi:hypothetical protein